jgi:hypothetical protein
VEEAGRVAPLHEALALREQHLPELLRDLRRLVGVHLELAREVVGVYEPQAYAFQVRGEERRLAGSGSAGRCSLDGDASGLRIRRITHS